MNKLNHDTLIMLGCLSLLIFAVNAVGDEPVKDRDIETTDTSASGMMDEAMMAKMKEYATPNEHHKLMDQLVGSWSFTMKWWMGAEATVSEESEGTSEIQWIMGGRFIQENVNGTSMGQPFTGMGIMGYDNALQKYNSIWLDSMHTGMMKGSGNFDAANSTWQDQGDFSCPITNSPRAYRSVVRIIDENTRMMEMYLNDLKSGKEYKSMEITYTRKK